MNLRFFYILILFLPILSCNNNNEYNLHNTQKTKKTLIPKYAKGFKIEYFKNYKKITVFNPWDSNKIFWQYFIFNNDTVLPENKNSIFYMHTANKTIVLSATQTAMLDKLNLIEKVTAIDDSTYIYNKKIINYAKNKKIKLVGDVSILNREKVVKLNPDIIFTSGWNKINPQLSKLINLNYKIAFVLEWQENSLLARAEWIKYIAAFYNKENLADSLFNITEQKYNLLKNKIKTSTHSPIVMQGSYTADNWYAAGGRSYIANLINDAGGNYILKNDTNTGSIPISFEKFFDKAKNADFWITTIDKNTIIDKRIKYFKSVKNSNIYSNTNKIDNKGGNDYWETGITNPDLILKDLIKILHPDILPNYKLTFYKKTIITNTF